MEGHRQISRAKTGWDTGVPRREMGWEKGMQSREILGKGAPLKPQNTYEFLVQRIRLTSDKQQSLKTFIANKWLGK